MSEQCGFLKLNGERCRGVVRGGDARCWAHDPKYQEARNRGQARGGKNKPSREIVAIKQRLSGLAGDVLSGRMDKGAAAVAAQVYNVYLRAIATELKVKETDELEARIEALEGTGA